MMVKGIMWVGVCTADWDRTVAFYRDVLGFSIRSEGLLSVRLPILRQQRKKAIPEIALRLIQEIDRQNVRLVCGLDGLA